MLVVIPIAQSFWGGHCPIEHHRGLLQLVLRRVHHHREQVEPAVEVRPVEAGVAVEEQAEEEAQPVDLPERVLAVGQPLDLARVVGLARQAQLPHQGPVRVLLVVDELRAPRDVRAVRGERAGAAGLAAPEHPEDGRPAVALLAGDRHARVVAGVGAGLPAAGGVQDGVGRGDGVHHLVDLDAPGQDHAVLDAVEHHEQLRQLVGRRGRRPAVAPGDPGEALVGHDAEQELDPGDDGELPVLEDRAGRRREGASARPAAPSAHAPAVAPEHHYVVRVAPRAGLALVGVEKRRVELAPKLVEPLVLLPLPSHHEPLGRRERRVVGTVPGRGGRRGHVPSRIHGW